MSSPVPAEPNVPPGTYPPGTPISLERTKVVVDRFLAEGGFAHVYIVRDQATGEKAVLKRTACPDEDSLEVLMREINIMVSVTGHKNIVDFYDSHISPSRHGGYEVFILMEYCSGGHLVDFMNTRLQERLKQHEVLSIFSDVCEAVAHMHFMPDPILHRDIKVENVLISRTGVFKLCDFGSATHRKVPAGASLGVAEIRALDEEVDKMTTLQYRAPELCDLYQKKGISEKVDTWTTPFEESGKLAILNARYSMPSYPTYSSDVLRLIERMLEIEPRKRYNIYQVYSELCRIRGVPCTMENRCRVEEDAGFAKPSLGTTLKTRAPEEPIAPPTTITPMRRGRPTPKQNTTGSNPLIPLASLGKSNDSFASEASQQPLQQSQQIPISLDQLSLSSNAHASTTSEAAGTFDPFEELARAKSAGNLKKEAPPPPPPKPTPPKPPKSLSSRRSIGGNEELRLKPDPSPPTSFSATTETPPWDASSSFLSSDAARRVHPFATMQRPKSEGSSLDAMWAFATGHQKDGSSGSAASGEDATSPAAAFSPGGTAQPQKPPRNRKPPPPPPPSKRKGKDGSSSGSFDPLPDADGYAPLVDDEDESSDKVDPSVDPFLAIARGSPGSARRPLSMG
ncbi:hypothetical protein HDU96_004211 [Phlyctochytrium bullatum]|nr:hypothetical protein HDU96_004211 [Phlyctochytrium bullatum]